MYMIYIYIYVYDIIYIYIYTYIYIIYIYIYIVYIYISDENFKNMLLLGEALISRICDPSIIMHRYEAIAIYFLLFPVISY